MMLGQSASFAKSLNPVLKIATNSLDVPRCPKDSTHAYLRPLAIGMQHKRRELM
jgi:hypothetical protein